MVRNVMDRLAAQKVQEDQSKMDNNSLINQLLPLSPFSNLKQFYLNIDSEPQTV